MTFRTLDQRTRLGPEQHDVAFVTGSRRKTAACLYSSG